MTLARRICCAGHRSWQRRRRCLARATEHRDDPSARPSRRERDGQADVSKFVTDVFHARVGLERGAGYQHICTSLCLSLFSLSLSVSLCIKIHICLRVYAYTPSQQNTHTNIQEAHAGPSDQNALKRTASKVRARCTNRARGYYSSGIHTNTKQTTESDTTQTRIH